MIKRIRKNIALFVTLSMIALILVPLKNDGSWVSAVFSAVSDVFAADGNLASGVTYSFIMGNSPVANGGEINYSLYSTTDRSLSILLTATNADGSPAPFPAGTKISWSVNNDNIVRIVPGFEDKFEVKLNIISPGYSGLSVSLTDVTGADYRAVAYCSIYVPLEWSDNTQSENNNILADSNGGRYGLLYAQTHDQARTLQLYTPDSAAYPQYSHYLRMLKYVDYNYVSSSPKAGQKVSSDVEPSELATITSALLWESSDTSVVRVDSLSGLVTAVSAGFATITVTTSTINEKENRSDSLSFNVVVVPEGYVVGYTDAQGYLSANTVTVSPTESDIVIQTNAHFANSLNWKLFQGDQPVASKDITSKYANNIEIGEANGRVVLSGLPCGVYHLTGIARKDASAATVKPTYGFDSNIIYFQYTIIVPFYIDTTPIVLNYYREGTYDTYDMSIKTNAPFGTFRYLSNDIAVATVDPSSGIVSAKGVGKTKVSFNKASQSAITAIFGDYANDPVAIGYDGNPVYVDVQVVNGITISSTNETMAVGANLQLYLTAPNPYEGEITWSSSNPQYVTVSDTGLVTALSPTPDTESVVVSVSIKVGGTTKRAKCYIKVTAAVSEITLNSKTDYVEVQENLTISATTNPKLNNSPLSWAVSDPSIASIVSVSDLSVTIQGVKPGTVVVSAINGSNLVVATKIIRVIQGINKITLSDTSVTLPLSAGFYQMYATCTPELPPNQSLTWSSSDQKVVKVDQNGKVTLIKPGRAVITVVSENGIMALCNFTITQGVTGIVPDEVNITMKVGEKHRVTYTVNPSTASNTVLKWTSFDSKIVTVDSSGYFTAKNVGSTVVMVSATDGTGVYTTINVTVTRNATAIKLDASAVTLNVGESYVLETTLTPAGSSDTLSYETSNSKVATVSKLGKITAKSKGVCIVMVKTETGLSTYCSVTVVQQVTGISIDKPAATIEVKDELELIATITPKSASDTSITWASTNSKVASVNEKGLVKGLQAGVTIIKATTVDGNYMAYSLVTVKEKVTSITMKDTASLYYGEKLALKATISNKTASDQTLNWSSNDESKVTVDEKGVIKGVGVGKAIVKVTANDGSNAYAECEVTVLDTPLTLQEEATMVLGTTLTLQGKIKNAKAGKDNSSWTSSNEAVCTVSPKGVVTANSVGNCVITMAAVDGSGSKLECEIKVIPNTISLQESATIGVGKELALDGRIGGQPATKNNSTWTTSDEKICVVSPKGVITGVGVGKCIITMKPTDGSDIFAECEVEVYNATDSIEIDPSNLYIEMMVGESREILYSLDPTGATYKPTFASANPAIATVTKEGRITALKAGSTTVTLTAGDNPDITGTVAVKVVEPVLASSVTLSDAELIMIPGESKVTVATTTPANISESHTWNSDNPTVASVDSNGRITANAIGTANITYMTKSGKKASLKVFVVGLSETNVVLAQYEKLLLNLEIDGSGSSNLSVRWGTKNQLIAEMSNGSVTAKALGTTTVYAVVNGRMLECKVTVIKNSKRK